jgi:hypothetical protein
MGSDVLSYNIYYDFLQTTPTNLYVPSTVGLIENAVMNKLEKEGLKT